jgi:hypothetical protein
MATPLFPLSKEQQISLDYLKDNGHGCVEYINKEEKFGWCGLTPCNYPHIAKKPKPECIKYEGKMKYINKI